MVAFHTFPAYAKSWRLNAGIMSLNITSQVCNDLYEYKFQYEGRTKLFNIENDYSLISAIRLAMNVACCQLFITTIIIIIIILRIYWPGCLTQQLCNGEFKLPLVMKRCGTRFTVFTKLFLANEISENLVQH